MALVVIIIYNIWTYVGYNTVIYLAGLGNVPREMYEAAEIDGANRWEMLRNVTIPLVSPTTYFLIMMGVLGTFRAFNHIYVLTTGRPLGFPEGTTMTASMMSWRTGVDIKRRRKLPDELFCTGIFFIFGLLFIAGFFLAIRLSP